MEFKVTGNIKHNSQDYVAGDVIDLTEGQAAPLIEVGALEDPNAEVEEEAAPAKASKKDKPTKASKKASGEPSIDEKETVSKDEARDITPVVDNDVSADL